MLRLSSKLRAFPRLPHAVSALVLVAVVGATPAAAQRQQRDHHDDTAGLGFDVPFPVGQTKVGAQVDALVREDGTHTVPEGSTMTSAVYAAGGVPFVVVWTRAYPAGGAPTRADFAELASFSAKSPAAAGERFGLKSFSFDEGRLRGVGEFAPKAVPDGLSSRVMMVATKEAFVFVALFDRDEVAISRSMARLAQSTLVDEDRRLVLDALPRGFRLSTVWALLGAVLVAAGGVGLWMRKRRV
jgi:hypothetical protein